MVAHCAVPGNSLIWDSDYQGNLAYLAAAAGGMRVIDFSNPENPVFVSRYAALYSSGQDIKAWGDYVYIADGNGGMEVIDVSDPLFPFSVGYCSLPDGATGLDISWPFVMMSDYILGGVQVIDATLPQVPYVTAYYKPSGCFAMGIITACHLEPFFTGSSGEKQCKQERSSGFKRKLSFERKQNKS